MKIFKILLLALSAKSINPARPGSEPVDTTLAALASQIEELKFFIADITRSRDDESKHLQVNIRSEIWISKNWGSEIWMEILCQKFTVKSQKLLGFTEGKTLRALEIFV